MKACIFSKRQKRGGCLYAKKKHEAYSEEDRSPERLKAAEQAVKAAFSQRAPTIEIMANAGQPGIRALQLRADARRYVTPSQNRWRQ
jgi:hypothetical protein